MKTDKTQIAEKLNLLLADYQIYYQNLRGLHWNVKGPKFFVLHEKYEEYYHEAAEAIDEVAERILMIGGKPFHTFNEYLGNAQLKEAGYITDAKEGVEVTLENNKHLLKKFYEVIELAEGDEATVALMSDFIVATEKRIWMLDSTLK